jgi:hypothetical protein
MGATSVSAQTVTQGTCVDEPGLAFFDKNNDGSLDVPEIQAVGAAFPDDAELQALVQRVSANPTLVIQYTGNCDGAGTTPTPGTGTTPTPATGTTPTPGAGDDDDDDNGTGTTPTPGTGTTPPPGTGDDDDDDNGDGVSELPDTGTGVSDGQNGATLLLVGVGGVLALVGAFALRLRSQV